MNKGVNLKIKGKVQGVFFRVSAQEKAQELDLMGWIKNKTDGTVVIEAEGEEQRLQELINWCQAGPEYAKVDDIKVEWQTPTGKFKDFTINH
ncbi:MAG: acylphosphatase [Parcubacteria group bacterium]|nr:acylphosphatase [Parcubacteria group bacterium]